MTIPVIKSRGSWEEMAPYIKGCEEFRFESASPSDRRTEESAVFPW